MPTPRTSSVARPAAPKPLTLGQRYTQQRAQARTTRLLVVGSIVLLLLIPVLPPSIGPLPNPLAQVPGQGPTIAAWDWRGALLTTLAPTMLLPLPFDSLGIGLPPVLLGDLLRFAVALVGLIFCLLLAQHLLSLYMQRTRPLAAQYTYLRLLIPPGTRLTTLSGAQMLRTLHGMLPVGNRVQGAAAPLVLRWTGQPEQPVEQGISVCGPPTLITSLIKTFEGLAQGTNTTANPDPLLEQLGPGRVLAVADVRAAAPNDLPIAVAGKDGTPLLDALIPALSPQTGVFAADVQLIVQPIGDRAWRTPVLARQEQLKEDTAAAEKRALEAKAAGPAYRIGMRLRAVAETPEAAQAMLTTLGATLSSSVQTVGNTQQRLVMGPVQVFPAVMEPPPPPPRALTIGGWVTGGILTLLLALLCWQLAFPLLAWAIPLLALPLPLLALLALYRRQTRAATLLAYRSVLANVLPPVNPQLVPIIGDWLGHS